MSERECYCYSRQCEICTPSRLTVAPKVGGDLERAVAMLAADNCRLIDIALAADWLEDAARALVQDAHPSLYTNLRAALDKYKAVRNGQ